MIEWLKKTFSESASASASRQLFAVLVVAFCVAMLFDVRARGFSLAWATAVGSIVGALGAVWWRGKNNGGGNVDKEKK